LIFQLDLQRARERSSRALLFLWRQKNMNSPENPSPPKAPRWARLLLYALLLLIAIASIWFIDIGGGRGVPPASTQSKPQP
jgi:hypothetical protein